MSEYTFPEFVEDNADGTVLSHGTNGTVLSHAPGDAVSAESWVNGDAIASALATSVHRVEVGHEIPDGRFDDDMDWDIDTLVLLPKVSAHVPGTSTLRVQANLVREGMGGPETVIGRYEYTLSVTDVRRVE